MAEANKGAIVGWSVIGGIVGLSLLADQFSRPSAQSQSLMSTAVPTDVAASTEPTPEPILPLSDKRIVLARRHFTMAARAEGLSGAMIYSQNCYDALARRFDWGKLDQCGGFDAFAQALVPETDAVQLESEVSYFEEEAAAGRYISAATKAGEEPSKADLRLEALRKAALKLIHKAPKAAPTIEPEEDDEFQVNDEPAEEVAA